MPLDTDTPDTDTDTAPETTTCEACNEQCNTDDLHTVDGEVWCQTCTDDNARPCPRCEETMPSDSFREIRQESNRRSQIFWCGDCAERHTTNCESCRVATDDQYLNTIQDSGGGEQQWCSVCTEDNSHYWESDGESHDEPEPEEEDDEALPDYHSTEKSGYRPIESPWILRQTPRVARHQGRTQPFPLYFGAELEIEVGTKQTQLEAGQKAKKQLGALCAGYERDGSLDRGVEIITHPAGLDTHREAWPKLNLAGCRSHDVATCGLHVHFSRRAVSSLTVAKLVHLLGRKADEGQWATVFRRSFNRYIQACTKEKISDGVKGRDRYDVVNVTNAETIEIRWAKGSLVPSTVVATIELVYAAIRYCEQTSLRCLSFAGLLHYVFGVGADEATCLRAYLVERLDLPIRKWSRAEPCSSGVTYQQSPHDLGADYRVGRNDKGKSLPPRWLSLDDSVRQRAALQSTDVEVLSHLLSDAVPSVVCVAMANPHASAEAVNGLRCHIDAGVRFQLASSSAISSLSCEVLAGDDISDVRSALAENAAVPHSVVDAMCLVETSTYARARLAKVAVVPCDLLCEWIRSDSSVSSRVVQNTRATTEMLKCVVCDHLGDHAVRCLVVHPNLGSDQIDGLLKHYARHMTAQLQLASHPNLSAKSLADGLAGPSRHYFLRNPNVPAAALVEALSRGATEASIDAVMRNPNCPINAAIAVFSKRRTQSFGVESRPLTPEVWALLAKNVDIHGINWATCVQNPTCTTEVLELMFAQDNYNFSYNPLHPNWSLSVLRKAAHYFDSARAHPNYLPEAT